MDVAKEKTQRQSSSWARAEIALFLEGRDPEVGGREKPRGQTSEVRGQKAAKEAWSEGHGAWGRRKRSEVGGRGSEASET